METLAAVGFQWFNDFSSVDILHDLFGLEVTGISTEQNALTIEAELRQLFSAWRLSYLSFKDGDRDPGWKVVIHRDSERETGLHSDA